MSAGIYSSVVCKFNVGPQLLSYHSYAFFTTELTLVVPLPESSRSTREIPRLLMPCQHITRHGIGRIRWTGLCRFLKKGHNYLNICYPRKKNVYICTEYIYLGYELVVTRTTRTPAFWGYSPPPHDYPYYWIIMDPKLKEDKVKVINLKNLLKFQQTVHATHLLKLLDKMCKYEMDPVCIVEDTERTQFCPQTDKVKPIYPF